MNRCPVCERAANFSIGFDDPIHVCSNGHRWRDPVPYLDAHETGPIMVEAPAALTTISVQADGGVQCYDSPSEDYLFGVIPQHDRLVRSVESFLNDVMELSHAS